MLRLLHVLPMMLILPVLTFAQLTVVQPKMVHIRNSEPREWSEFKEKADGQFYKTTFADLPNATAVTLVLRQYDVKLSWKVFINGKQIGMLVQDESDLRQYLEIPAHLLQKQNTLEISSIESVADDIRVGEIFVDHRAKAQVLSQSSIEIEIHDKSSGKLVPSQLTITSRDHVLQQMAPSSIKSLAVRIGHVYTADGKVLIDLPAGKYMLYASHGFEYSADSIAIDLKEGIKFRKNFLISREVNTEGWVSCDTHVHTFTHSKHGDATDQERVITLAAEGIELPIITDHNVHVDLKAEAMEAGVTPYFTLVTGDEVTTKVGHFNVFPTDPGKAVANANVNDWVTLAKQLNANDPTRVVILNHGRDVHNQFRPLDPSLFISASGQRLDRQPVFFNAMEVLNTGSQQSNLTQLFHDWMGMLNNGSIITPVGSSDSHDVSRFIVGQGRTYIAGNDSDPAKLDVRSLVKNFREGRVSVSSGLFVNLKVNEKYGPGMLVQPSDSIDVNIQVSGPGWSDVGTVTLYANGEELVQRTIRKIPHGPLKYELQLRIPSPAHDIFLVACAVGDATQVPFWRLSRPYQPTSPFWKPKWFGATGAIWIDGDKNGKRDTAIEYAKRVIGQSVDDYNAIIASLNRYDGSVAVQVASILRAKGIDFESFEITQAMTHASFDTRQAFKKVQVDFSNRVSPSPAH